MRNWRYAYNTNGLAHHRLSDAVDLLADLGYEAIALTPDVGHLDPRTATATDVSAFDSHVRRRGLAVSIQTGARFALDPRRKHHPTLLDPDATARKVRVEFLVRCLDIGRDVGATTLSFWSGATGATPAGRESSATLTSRLVDGCRAVAEAAADRGMVAAFEPEPGMFVSTVDHWTLLSRVVAHPAFRLALDVGHVHCNGEGDPARLIRQHQAMLADVQIEDMKVGQHVHLAFGEGTFDVGPTMQTLRGSAYDGHVGVELSRDSHRAPEVAAAAIAHLKRYCP
ncbi:MAG: sugar phosphate isomerase/epimerase [Planctomycetes bacterium]|nr:sugar phosphate isomerase/epimerase [Planctomycetota bacterium]